MIDKIFQNIKRYTKNVPAILNKYRYPIGGALILILFTATIYRIDTLSSPGVNKDRYNAGVLEQEKVVFNEDAIDRINDLDERNVNPTGSIDENRNNPF